MTPAIDFLSRVRQRFANRDPDVYKRFVELIQAIPKGDNMVRTLLHVSHPAYPHHP